MRNFLISQLGISFMLRVLLRKCCVNWPLLSAASAATFFCFDWWSGLLIIARSILISWPPVPRCRLKVQYTHEKGTGLPVIGSSKFMVSSASFSEIITQKCFSHKKRMGQQYFTAERKNFSPTATHVLNFLRKYILFWLAITKTLFTFVLANQAKH